MPIREIAPSGMYVAGWWERGLVVSGTLGFLMVLDWRHSCEVREVQGYTHESSLAPQVEGLTNL